MPDSKFTTLIFLIFAAIFILIMIAFIIKILFVVQKKQKGFNDDLMAVRANYEKELYKAQLEIQEQTFQQIAREIHDNVGQMVSLAKLGLGTLDFEKKEEAKESILEISDILEKALDDLRHMSRTLNSEILHQGGLKKSIEMQVGFLQRGGKLNAHLDLTGEPYKLNEQKEIILFRILQEAVNNILRHSSATDICISLIYEKAYLKLQIKDNGKGFNLNEQKEGPNQLNGLNNMQHRAKLIDAEFLLDSTPGKGTLISVTTTI